MSKMANSYRKGPTKLGYLGQTLLSHDVGGRSYESGMGRPNMVWPDSDDSSIGDLNMETDTDSEVETEPEGDATNAEKVAKKAKSVSDSSSDSGLSSLGSTPSPPGSPTTSSAPTVNLPSLPKCECKGWCVCKKYKYFYSGAYKGVRSLEDAESQGYKLPSQTHLRERTLAGEKLTESTMRKSVGSHKKTAKEQQGKKTDGQHFTWEDGEQPVEMPRSWAGDD